LACRKSRIAIRRAPLVMVELMLRSLPIAPLRLGTGQEFILPSKQGDFFLLGQRPQNGGARMRSGDAGSTGRPVSITSKSDLLIRIDACCRWAHATRPVTHASKPLAAGSNAISSYEGLAQLVQ
jgi:hypothetical protein